MKSTTGLLGLILIIAGVLVLAYQGFTYTKHENVAQIGNVNVTAETQKTVHLPPIAGGIALIAGILLVLVSRKAP
jgi:hypothetical protein